MDVDARADDNSLSADSWIRRWCDNQHEGFSKIGLNLHLAGSDLKSMMEEAGFVNIVVKDFKIPIGTWPADPKMREIGAFQLVAMLDGLQGLTMAVWTRFLGWSTDEVEIVLAKVRAEWRNSKIHTYWPL